MSVSCVIKLGGSLLDLPDLQTRLPNFLADFSRPRPVLTCGGGPAVDLIRQWDRAYDLGEEASHWIALRALTITALVIEQAVPQLEHTESSGAFEAIWAKGKVPLYDAYAFIRELDEASRDPLPRRWRITSDSLAARMAALLGAPEVILLKSVTPPDGVTIEGAARAGIVDAHFPAASRGVDRVILFNLREDEAREVILPRE